MNFFYQAFLASNLSVGELANMMGYAPSTVNGMVGPKAKTLTVGCRELGNIHVRLCGVDEAFIHALDISPAFVAAWVEQEKKFKSESAPRYPNGEIYALPAVDLYPFAHKPPHFRHLRSPKLAQHILAVKRAIKQGHISPSIFTKIPV